MGNKGSNELDVTNNDLQPRSADELLEVADGILGTGENAMESPKIKEKKTVIVETPVPKPKEPAKEESKPVSPTTTIHVTRATNEDIDALYKLAGYKSKLEFSERAFNNLIALEKGTLTKRGIDVNSIMDLMKNR